jgi:hypothetical protein
MNRPAKKTEEKVRVCSACSLLVLFPGQATVSTPVSGAPSATPTASSSVSSAATSTPSTTTSASTPVGASSTTTTNSPSSSVSRPVAGVAAASSSSSSLPKSTSSSSSNARPTTNQLVGLCCGYVIDGVSSLPLRYVRILVQVEVGDGSKANNGRIIGVGSGGDRLSLDGSPDSEVSVESDLKTTTPSRLPSWPVLIFPVGTRVIDLRRKWVMPGLIDCHVHPFISDEDYQISHLRKSSGTRTRDTDSIHDHHRINLLI